MLLKRLKDAKRSKHQQEKMSGLTKDDCSHFYGKRKLGPGQKIVNAIPKKFNVTLE